MVLGPNQTVMRLTSFGLVFGLYLCLVDAQTCLGLASRFFSRIRFIAPLHSKSTFLGMSGNVMMDERGIRIPHFVLKGLDYKKQYVVFADIHGEQDEANVRC